MMVMVKGRRKIFTVVSNKDFNQDLIIWLFTYKPSTRTDELSTIDQGWSRCWGRLRPSPAIYIHTTDELNYILLLDYKFTLPKV
jgi:hypothetical protein